MAKELSVLMPWGAKTYNFFFHDFIIIFRIRQLIMIKTCPEKNLSVLQTYN